MKEKLDALLTSVYESLEGSEMAQQYDKRHGIESMGVLTVYDQETAGRIAELLRPRIEGKVVVEIGSGIGLLALYLGLYARKVYAIEADPAWSWCFVGVLYATKPKHVTWILGLADELPPLGADVALFCTHSGRLSMRAAGERHAREVIDVYDEMPNVRAERQKILAELGLPDV